MLANDAGIGGSIGRSYRAWLANDVNYPGAANPAHNALTRLTTSAGTGTRLDPRRRQAVRR